MSDNFLTTKCLENIFEDACGAIDGEVDYDYRGRGEDVGGPAIYVGEGTTESEVTLALSDAIKSTVPARARAAVKAEIFPLRRDSLGRGTIYYPRKYPKA